MFNDSNSSPMLTNCEFVGNDGTYGAGMSNRSNSSPTLTNCKFVGNDGTYGVGMYNSSNSSPTLTNCNFVGNDGTLGVGMYNSSNSSPTLTNCIFRDNTAYLTGGGMYNSYSGPTLSNCTFSQIVANDSGGGIKNSYYSNPTLSNCTFNENSANEFGGGMYNSGISSPILTNCTFNENSAIGGGGICNESLSSPTITNCIFSDNTADWVGGGMCNFWNSSPTMKNCIFSGNSADEDGGAISCEDSNSTITNCTFTGNSALNGNAVACDSYWHQQSNPSSLQLTNCILFNDGDEIWNNDNSTITVTYSDVQGGWPGQGNIDADPCFAEFGFWDANGTPGDANDDFWVEGDYHLLPNSPCIDAGDPCYVPGPNETDLGGLPRVFGGRVDMGAYEFSYIQARMLLFPQTINRQSQLRNIMAWIKLPEGITKDQIDQDSPILLYPGPLEPINQYIFEHGQKGQKQTSILILYDKAELLSAVPNNGLVDLEAVGILNNSRYFYGSGFVTILGRQQPQQWRLLKKK